MVASVSSTDSYSSSTDSSSSSRRDHRRRPRRLLEKDDLKVRKRHRTRTRRRRNHRSSHYSSSSNSDSCSESSLDSSHVESSHSRKQKHGDKVKKVKEKDRSRSRKHKHGSKPAKKGCLQKQQSERNGSPVQLSKFLGRDKDDSVRRSAVSGKKILLKLEKTKEDKKAETNRNELLKFLNASYD
ncbi:hypothetical protein M5K25_013837 [Dendrobium thyrsiflorum]|uniref:Uncharacterized protein n=1 Tax=Dendrobium thyrsiflorum TaxID=117978 RepID=A0ABD0UUL0_DENTH